MDRLRVGSFITGGRFVPALDINDGTKYALVRDTLTFTPPDRKQQFSSAGRRYGGSNLSSEVTDNGGVSAEWYVNGGSADASITLLENLLQQVEMISAGRFIEWMSDGASQPIYYEIVGPASWEPMYRWIEFQGTKTLHVKAGWKVSPLVQGAPMEVLEDFTPRGTVAYQNLIANPGFEGGTTTGWITANSAGMTSSTFAVQSGWSQSGVNALRITGTHDATSTVLSSGVVYDSGGGSGAAKIAAAPGDTWSAQVTFRVIDPPATTGRGLRLRLRWRDASNTSISDTLSAETSNLLANTTYTLTVTGVAPAGTSQVGLVAEMISNVASDVLDYYIDNVILVKGALPPAYFDGDSLSSSWDGARGVSTSTQYVAGTATLSDFTSDTGSTNYTIANGQLRPLDTNEIRLIHTVRGYTYEDVQVTMKYTTGATPTSGSHGLFVKRLGAGDLIQADIFSGTLRILKKINGTYTTLMNPSITALAASTTYWLRLRTEGNVIYAEHWTTQPTPMGTPAVSTSWTLSGLDVAAFGVGVQGQVGIRSTAQPVDTAYDDFTVEPFVYRNQTLPNTIKLGGTIPGMAPSLADVTITPSGGASAPMSALLGWAARPGNTGLAGSPFGIIEGESATSVLTWAVTADANYRNGSGLKYTFSGSNGYAEAFFNVDPSLLVPDDFTQAGEVAVEVWARMDVPFYPTAANGFTGVYSFSVASSVRPQSGLNYGAERWTMEYGSAGKLVSQPTAQGLRFIRVGTLHMVADKLRPSIWQLKLSALFNNYGGGSPVIGLDYLVLVPARRRASSPTGKIGDATYPRFVPSTSESSKVIRSDLSGALCQPPNNSFPDTGLGGQQIELPPGNVDIVAKLSSLAPDDPTLNALSEQLSHSATVKVSPTPRWFFARGN